ncbi:hypothetical protein N7G274_007745 [Stereocaulon virgatum]|uniref:Heterokaryon incompatibility domain-containing protein n=1 Tax=Stereocaulon virgatum TaxID=373712 RepID=A0ABR4A813_9LECA
MIQGVQWPVTVNLEAGLRHLRHRSVPRTIWIDAICINQRCTEERMHQVQLMKTIYGDATVVRVWLGEKENRSKEAMWASEQIARERNVISLMKSKVINNQDLKKLLILLQRPWWSRVWVLQEVVLPKKVTIRCGRASLGEGSFKRLMKDVDFLPPGPDVVLNVKNFTDFHNFHQSWYNTSKRIIFLRRQKRSPSKDSPFEFTMILGHGVISHCSDP